MSTTGGARGEEIAKALRAQGVKPGAGTASGVAAAGRVGEQTATEPEGEMPKDAGMLGKGARAVGEQKEPAIMTPSGSIESNMIASSTGPVPVGLVAKDEAEAEAMRARVRENAGRSTARRILTEVDLANMSKAEVRAVAHDRGYDVGEGGRRVLQARFLKAQEADKINDLAKPTAAEKKIAAVSAQDQALVTGGTGAATVAGIPIATENRVAAGSTPVEK